MRKNIFYLLLVLSICLIPNFVMASTCSYEEQAKLNGIAANVKVNYEEASEEMNQTNYLSPAGVDTESQSYSYLDDNQNDIVEETNDEDNSIKEDLLKLTILNITNDIYVKITNNQNNNLITINYSDTSDGVYTFNWKDIYAVTTLNISVYSASNTSCPNELYNVNYLTLPRLNDNYQSAYCTGNEDYYLCQKYVSFDKMNSSDFIKNMETYNNGKSDNTNNNIKQSFWQKYYKQIIIVGTILAIIVISMIIIIKRRKIK